MKIAIIGAGIIGVTTAYYLCRAGYEVSLIDKENDIAQLTSWSNGAQLSYSYTEPLGSPALLRNIPKIILGKSSATKIDNYLDKKLWSWGVKLILNCSPSKYAQNKEQILELALFSYHLMAEILKEHNFNFEYKQNGKLFIFEDKKDFQKFAKNTQYLKKYNIKQQILSKDECLQKEPILKNKQDIIAGGVFSPNDAVGDSYQFCKEIQNYLMNNYNLSLHLNAYIDDITVHKNAIRSIKSDNMEIVADMYIICGGAFSDILLKKIMVKNSLYPIKGYSIRIKNTDKYKLNHNITDYSKKLVFAPLDSHLRISGMMHFAGFNSDIKQKDIEIMINNAKKTIPELDLSNAEITTGFRPYTPSSCPQVGKTKYKNMFLNIGHGMFGWTLALGSAKKLSDIILHNRVYGG